MMAMIVVDNLVKVFEEGTIREKRAVDALSFRVEAGQIYGLLGPNGAGKTTTLRILSGLMKPTRGRAILAGHNVETEGRAVKQSIGFLTANTGLYQRLTPREMLRFFAAMHGLDENRTEARVELLIDWLGMGDFADLRGGALSTGQRQRTNIARALIPDPPILIMDEPTLGLDVLSNRVILDFIVRERDEGKSVLLSTHYLDEAEGMCDRIGLMHRGRLIAEGTLDELRALSGETKLTEVFLKLIDADKPQLPADRPQVDAAR